MMVGDLGISDASPQCTAANAISIHDRDAWYVLQEVQDLIGGELWEKGNTASHLGMTHLCKYMLENHVWDGRCILFV